MAHPHTRARADRIWLIFCVICVVGLTSVFLHHTSPSWRINARSPGAIAFGPGYLGVESTDFFGETRWFRHVRNQTPIGIPNLASDQIVELHALTRSVEPPQSIQLQSDSHTISLPTQPQSWRIRLYVPANTQYQITCDNRHVTSAYNQQICLSVVHITGVSVGTVPSLSLLLYLVIPLGWVVLFGVAFHVSQATSLVRYGVMMGVVGSAIMLIDAYALQLHAWRWGITTALVCAIGGVLLLKRFPVHYRAIGSIVLIALLIKILGFVTPGARYADLQIHIMQFENVLRGNLYQQMDGTIARDLIDQNKIQTYPYPPLAYLVIAPFSFLTEGYLQSRSIIGMLTILIDASLVVGIVWLARQLSLSWPATTIAALTYVALPQSFILQNHTAAAQVIGLWASWVFMFVAGGLGALTQRRQTLWLVLMAIITSAGHFGTLLTTSVVQAFHLVMKPLRRAAWIWFGVVSGISVLYYSQFFSLILDQFKYLTRDTGASRWNEVHMIFNVGVFDHYSAIIFVLGILAVWHPRFRRNPQIWSIWVAAFATFVALTLLRIGIFVSPTRYVIMLSPLIAVGIGSISAGYFRTRIGQLMVMTLLSYEVMMAIDAWTTYKITHHLVRWIVPQ